MQAGRITPWAAAGVGVGMLASALLVVSGWLDRDEGPPASDDDAVVEFVDAWDRSRRGTYVVRSEFVRVLAGGGGFRADASLAQRPPDHLRVQFGSAVGRLGGEIVSCTTDDGGRYRCRRGEPSQTFDDEVAAELDTLRSYVDGPRPLYGVTAEGGGCFLLEQERPLPAPPYGTEARFCFDAATGAPTLVRIVRDEGTDITRAVDVRGEVEPRDLEPPREGERNPDPTPGAPD